jgi:hypothetical protein
MTTTSKIVRLCQDILALTIEQDAEKERLHSLLDDSITNLTPTTITAIVCDLRLLGIHESLLLNRNDYEYNREIALARDIVAAGDQSPLQNFRSAQWYHDAHHFENAALAQYSPKNILMVGCGPFPSTALSLMDSFPDANLTCLDKNATAYHLAIEVTEIFGHKLYGGCVDVLCLPGWTLEQYDCILVGTVVGVLEQEKSDIVNYFLHGVTPGTTLAFRTATGPGKIIYPTVDLSLLDGRDFRVLSNPPQKTWTTILIP